MKKKKKKRSFEGTVTLLLPSNPLPKKYIKTGKRGIPHPQPLLSSTLLHPNGYFLLEDSVRTTMIDMQATSLYIRVYVPVPACICGR
jgi:hypothetical protein